MRETAEGRERASQLSPSSAVWDLALFGTSRTMGLRALRDFHALREKSCVRCTATDADEGFRGRCAYVGGNDSNPLPIAATKRAPIFLGNWPRSRLISKEHSRNRRGLGLASNGRWWRIRHNL